MPELAIGDEIVTAGDGADDRPALGELRQIVHHTGITLATYRITAVWPPVAVGALWRFVGVITAVGDTSHSANDEIAPESQNL